MNSCQKGLQVNENVTGCEDLNECDFHPCGPGARCHNIESGKGWYCECPEKFSCTNCSCNEDRMMAREKTIIFGAGALAAIGVALVSWLGMKTKTTAVLLFFCISSISWREK